MAKDRVIRISNTAYLTLRTLAGEGGDMGNIIEQMIEQFGDRLKVKSKPKETYHLGKEPRMYAARNIHSWENVCSALSSAGKASYGQLVDACRDHDHPAGGKGFIEYCIKNEWLEKSN
jgi:hypothetical protein